MTLEAIKYSKGSLMILDQLLLPLKSEYIKITNTEDGWQAIKKMQVSTMGRVLKGIMGVWQVCNPLSPINLQSMVVRVRY